MLCDGINYKEDNKIICYRIFRDSEKPAPSKNKLITA